MSRQRASLAKDPDRMWLGLKNARRTAHLGETKSERRARRFREGVAKAFADRDARQRRAREARGL